MAFGLKYGSSYTLNSKFELEELKPTNSLSEIDQLIDAISVEILSHFHNNYCEIITVLHLFFFALWPFYDQLLVSPYSMVLVETCF